MVLSCIINIFISESTTTSKYGSKVTQGHQKWYHSIVYPWFLITVRNHIQNGPFLQHASEKYLDLETWVRGH